MNLEPVDLPLAVNEEFNRGYKVFDTQVENEAYAKEFGAVRSSKYDTSEDGFKLCSTTSRKVHSLEEILKFAKTSSMGSNMNKKLSDLNVGEYAYRCYVCYENLLDISSECFVTIWVKRIKASTPSLPSNAKVTS